MSTFSSAECTPDGRRLIASIRRRLIDLDLRSHGSVMDCLRSIEYTVRLTPSCKRELSSWLAQDYAPPKYATLGAAKAAASQHARIAWALSHGLGNTRAATSHDFIASLRRTSTRESLYPTKEEMARAIAEAVSSLTPIEESLLNCYFGLAEYERLAGDPLHTPSAASLADVTGLPSAQIEPLIAKALRKIRHPSRYSYLADLMPKVVRFKATQPEELFLHAVGLQGDDA